MSAVQIISSETIQILSSTKPTTSDDIIDLTPWDLQSLSYGPIQKGLLYHNQVDLETRTNQTQRLKHSLSSALTIFPPLAGRLQITQHLDDHNDEDNNNNTVSCSIVCNNEGALFVHAAVDNICVADVLELPPRIFHSFFALNRVRNYHGTSHPLLAIQVTELLDGIFVAFTINHVVVDGKSAWHFINSWAHISNTSSDNYFHQIPKHLSLQRWFPNTIQRPICFHFPLDFNASNDENENEKLLNYPYLHERFFHFTKEKIVELKAKANLEAGQNKISSLQALLSLVWRCVTRSKRLDPQEQVSFLVDIGVRSRLVPPLPDDYFGNAIVVCEVTMKVGELLEEGGFGKGALEMHKMISMYSNHDKIKNHYESWSRTPSFVGLGNDVDNVSNLNSLVISSSPWFDVYGNDFGWGKPVGARSGSSNKRNGKITMFAGVEEGSMDLEICLPYEILEAIGNDVEFMDVVSK